MGPDYDSYRSQKPWLVDSAGTVYRPLEGLGGINGYKNDGSGTWSNRDGVHMHNTTRDLGRGVINNHVWMTEPGSPPVITNETYHPPYNQGYTSGYSESYTPSGCTGNPSCCPLCGGC